MADEKIKEQIEFYFSDANYAKDKFLQSVAAKNDKCIPIVTVASFTRMKKLGATVENIKEAVASSDVVELVGESLRKIMSEKYIEYCKDTNVDKRVVHVSGFSLDATLDDLKEIIRPHCAPVKITMQRKPAGEFAGSCFLEFATTEEAEQALDLKIEMASIGGAEKENAEEEEAVKKQKLDPVYAVIKTKDEYLKTREKTKDAKEVANERFIKKVKEDFVHKLVAYESETEMGIADIKKLVKNTAFVDLGKKIIRMKYIPDWEEKEFEDEGKKIKLIKVSEEKAREYVSTIQIKKVPKKK